MEVLLQSCAPLKDLTSDYHTCILEQLYPSRSKVFSEIEAGPMGSCSTLMKAFNSLIDLILAKKILCFS